MNDRSYLTKKAFGLLSILYRFLFQNISHKSSRFWYTTYYHPLKKRDDQCLWCKVRHRAEYHVCMYFGLSNNFANNMQVHLLWFSIIPPYQLVCTVKISKWTLKFSNATFSPYQNTLYIIHQIKSGPVREKHWIPNNLRLTSVFSSPTSSECMMSWDQNNIYNLPKCIVHSVVK